MAAAQRLEALHADVSGRMEKALQGAVRFKRWGMHYNRALLRAHQVQLCTNFMDPGLQLYGGDLFLALKAQGDRIFLGLPPPTANKPPPPPPAVRAPVASGPTAAARRAAQAAQAAQRAARPPSPDMTTYYVSRLSTWSSGRCNRRTVPPTHPPKPTYRATHSPYIPNPYTYSKVVVEGALAPLRPWSSSRASRGTPRLCAR